ncbi:MAG TPA: ABC transporter substrate-binding protein [Xanthobacteraceae bacterium]|jgi:NitT/TauT family transport system substrate-binding protein|nr:ABC transporter substrate-binding protein [Xanthobacteraceae bacterium]
MKVLTCVVLAALGVSGLRPASAQETTVKVGIARSTSNAAELMALKRGYFKDAGITLQWDDIDTTANVIALLAQNQYNIVAGGISAGIFNALEKNLPITMLSDRVSTPIGHNLMLRPDLKDTVKSFKDLKGKVIASNGQGSVSTYEVGKMLEREGLTIADVDLKIVPFTQMGLAFRNQAIDAAIVIPPFVWQLEEQGLAVPFGNVDELVQPQPMTIAVIMANTDWIKANPELVQRYMTAWLRGARDYCNAYHGGADRQEVIDELVSSKTEPRRELLEKYPWPARSPYGRINTASMLDINAWYVTNKMSAQKFPVERIVDSTFIDAASKKLGPFELENKDSKLPGCRD